MGIRSTVASFGLGYVAGALSGRERADQLSARVQQGVSRLRGSIAGRSVDVREIREVMTAKPEAIRPTDTLKDAARIMRDRDIGDILVEDPQGGLLGIITDRDIAIRATAEGTDPSTKVEGVYSREIATLDPTDTVQDAVARMRAKDIRRLPVVEAGKAIGIVSLGDISVETAPRSLLADISTGSPDR
jgi:CBS domain-containing protein